MSCNYSEGMQHVCNRFIKKQFRYWLHDSELYPYFDQWHSILFRNEVIIDIYVQMYSTCTHYVLSKDGNTELKV